MDYWTDSPLNKAHFYERKAVACAKKFMYDEAIECHSLACVELDKSLQFTNNIKARESIRLQYRYHNKQKDFLRLKKAQYQSYKEALKLQKEAMSRIMRTWGGKEDKCENDGTGASLKMAIFRTIEEADSLLDLLVQKDEHNDCDVNGSENKNELEPLVDVTCGSKKPKDEKTVIEELKIANCQLRGLITELMAQLLSKEEEAEALCERYTELEAENIRLKEEVGNVESAYSSPIVLSPDDGTPSGQDGGGDGASELPNLTPVEMPNLDAQVLQDKNIDGGNDCND